MSFLFGHLCDTPCKFTHDQIMIHRMAGTASVVAEPRPASPGEHLSQVAGTGGATGRFTSVDQRGLGVGRRAISHGHSDLLDARVKEKETAAIRQVGTITNTVASSDDVTSDQPTRKRRCRSNDSPPSSNNNAISKPRSESELEKPAPPPPPDATLLSDQEYSEAWKQEAFEAALGTSPGSGTWNDISLVSVSGHHQQREEEL